MTPWFIATERFDSASGENWRSYVEWSGLSQLTELVSLDSMLCPALISDVRDHYWPHIVNEDFMLGYFTNLAFMLAELPPRMDWTRTNLLSVVRNPLDEPSIERIPFASEFLGYDLCDVYGGNSALSNCGGFPAAFENSEITRHGLITSRQRALDIQSTLRRLYPEETHADCHIWAIFRCIGAPERLAGGN